jgi:hypothetical protein
MPSADYATQAPPAEILERLTGLQLKDAYIEGEGGLHLVFEGGHILFIAGDRVCISVGRLEDSAPLH